MSTLVSPPEYSILQHEDLKWIAMHIPKPLIALMKEYPEQLMIGGGFIRALIARERPQDIDVFGPSAEVMKRCAEEYAAATEVDLGLPLNETNDDEEEYGGLDGSLVRTVNAITVRGGIPVQFIHKWTYSNPIELLDRFDFTIAQAVIWISKSNYIGNTSFNLKSAISPNFYTDLASKKLCYALRNKDECSIGGTVLRMLKFYSRGYRIPLNHLATILAEFANANKEGLAEGDVEVLAEMMISKLEEVDPQLSMHDYLDTSHVKAFLPDENISIEL